MVERGHKIPVHDWWLRLARSLVTNDPRDLITLGKDLAKHSRNKRRPFTYSTLSRFALGQSNVTLELAEALCKEYSRLPPPVVFPRSYEEAVHIVGVAEKYGTTIEAPDMADVVPMPQPKRRSRRRGSVVANVESQPQQNAAPASARRSR